MSLEKIYVVRHGFRTGWSVDHITGTYSSSIPSPTGIPVDPALTAHGVEQADELARHLARLDDPPVGVVYSSPYYRCLQTIRPFTSTATQLGTSSGTSSGTSTSTSTPMMIRPEYGLCEWFGAAPFEHPGPADPRVLKAMFPAWDETYRTVARPPPRGETMAQLRRRVEDTLRGVVERCDAEGIRGAVLCTHAAVVIMLGRVLTGAGDDDTEFDAFTCGLSVFRRKGARVAPPLPSAVEGRGGALGTWGCEANSDCSFLSGGAERGWRFSGDEDFPSTGSMDGSAPIPAPGASAGASPNARPQSSSSHKL